MLVPAMHRVRARSERLPASPAVRRVAGVLAVHDVRSDGEDRLRVDGAAIGRVFPQLVHERADQPRRELVHAIVVVAELRKLAFGLIVGDQAGCIADDADLGVPDRREAVGDDGHARHAERHRAQTAHSREAPFRSARRRTCRACSG